MGKRKFLTCFFILFGIIFASNAQSNWEPDFASLTKRPYPQWFKDAKLGIFIHWGVYSVPSYGGKESYGEWYLRGLQVGDSLRTTFMEKYYGKNFKYRDFAPLFKAELFKPDEWADLFKKAGARYIVMVTKHHDGYAMWPSKYAPGWNSMEVGPHRDLVGELAKAVRKKGIVFGAYYSLPEWNNPLHRWYTDPNDSISPYVEQHMIPQFKEMVSAYKPKVLFADGEWFNSAKQWHSAALISWYYNLVGDSAIVNNRWGGGSDIGFLTPEYSSGLKASKRPWAEVRGLGRSFGFNRNEPLEAYMSPEKLIRFFVTAVANGGGIILNVGPKGDGQIPLLQQERLKQLGAWLEVNGEAIYGSKMWERTEEDKEVKLRRIDSTINFDWVRNTPGDPVTEDDFTAEWNGFLQPKQTGVFQIDAEVDDAMQLWIDNQLIFEKSAKKNKTGEPKFTGEIKLKKGKKYAIRVRYQEKKQNAAIRLFWTLPSGQQENIPASCFFTSKVQKDPDGLYAIYTSRKQYIAYTANHGKVYAIALEWPDDFLELNMDEPPSGTKVTLLGRQGTLPWKYENGTMKIDVRSIKYNEMPSCYAWTFRMEGLNK